MYIYSYLPPHITLKGCFSAVFKNIGVHETSHLQLITTNIWGIYLFARINQEELLIIH